MKFNGSHLLCKIGRHTVGAGAGSSHLTLVTLLFLLFGASLGARGQYDLDNKQLMDDVRFTKITEGKYFKPNLAFANIQGSPYLSETFEPGKVITTEGGTFENIALRYNAFSDELQFKQGEEVFDIALKNTVKRAEFNNQTFSCIQYLSDGLIKTGYARILQEGKATLVVRYTTRFLDREEAKAFSDPQPARFEGPELSYYLLFDGIAAQLITNKKGLIGMFTTKKGEMATFITSHKLSFRKEEDLIKIVEHFNSL